MVINRGKRTERAAGITLFMLMYLGGTRSVHAALSVHGSRADSVTGGLNVRLCRAVIDPFLPLESQCKAFNDLLQQGADIDGKTVTEGTPLNRAAAEGTSDVVQLLLSLKADVNQADFFGHTPLICAASRGNKDTVRLLLEADANVNAQSDCFSVIRCAVNANHRAVVQLLVNAGGHFEYLFEAIRRRTPGTLVRYLTDNQREYESRRSATQVLLVNASTLAHVPLELIDLIVAFTFFFGPNALTEEHKRWEKEQPHLYKKKRHTRTRVKVKT